MLEMAGQNIAGFDWDDGNWPKASKHGVSQEEIEAMFQNSPAIFAHPSHSTTEQRLRAIGKNAAGRYIYAAFTLREASYATLIRPISARYMHRKEIAHYEQQRQDSETATGSSN
jgi:uncharacterized protein